MITKAISGSTFFADIQNDMKSAGGNSQHYNDGDLQYIASAALDFEIVFRTREELFSQTVSASYAAHKYPVIANGNQYNVTKSGITDALWGDDPVEAKETSPNGHIISHGALIAGNPEPQRFYIAFKGPMPPPAAYHASYEFGFGNPPSSSISAIGGLGPIIINGLKYGSQNLYSSGVPAGAPSIGQPGPIYVPYLLQRSNSTYSAMAARGNRVGKTMVALSRRSDILLVLVQPDGAKTGIALDNARDKLFNVGVTDAIFMDGSDSALLVYYGTFLITQDHNKDELTTVGFGIK